MVACRAALHLLAALVAQSQSRGTDNMVFLFAAFAYISVFLLFSFAAVFLSYLRRCRKALQIDLLTAVMLLRHALLQCHHRTLKMSNLKMPNRNSGKRARHGHLGHPEANTTGASLVHMQCKKHVINQSCLHMTCASHPLTPRASLRPASHDEPYTLSTILSLCSWRMWSATVDRVRGALDDVTWKRNINPRVMQGFSRSSSSLSAKQPTPLGTKLAPGD